MLKRYLQLIPGYVRWMFSVYFLGILFFTFFRIALLITNVSQLNSIPTEGRFSLFIQAFLMGLRFDTVISSYFLILPFLLFQIIQLVDDWKQKFSRIPVFIAGIFYSIGIIICSADVPYFSYYFSRLTTAVLNWKDEGGFMIGMITKEPAYLIFVITGFVSLFVFWRILFKSYAELLKPAIIFGKEVWYKKMLYTFFCVLVLFVGIRGRIELKSPIRAGTAFFSPYAFPNQLGLNPVFTFIRSALDDLDGRSKQLSLLSDSDAFDNTQRYLNVISGSAWSPVYRKISGANEPRKMNVVIVIMESMSASKLGVLGNNDKLTPFLDSLSRHALSFTSFYSSGIHTYNGVFSTLYAFPSLLKQHPMKVTTIPKMSGLPVTLSAINYHTMFFTTHDEQFDNMAGFMYANGFKEVISQKDFPAKYVLGPTGVPDHRLFEQAIPRIRMASESNKPFFAALLTASDHGPYNLPQDIPFRPTAEGVKKQIVQYADWSLKQFFLAASKEKWFENTIFVLLADHGSNINPVYEFPLSLVHSPLIIYSPAFADVPRSFSAPACQVDVFPTVMGLLAFPYDNYTFGVDVINESRKYAYFSNDEKIGVLDDKYYYIRKEDGSEQLFLYKSSSTNNLIFEKPDIAKEMRQYAFSMMQSAQKLLQSGNTVR